MTRGVLYVYWGDKLDQELRRSIQSVAKLGYDHTVVKLQHDAQLGDKSSMFSRTPYDLTLYLDTDTVMFQNVDFGFRMAEQHGIAAAIAPACFARRVVDGLTDEVEYNTGVLFFARTQEVSRVFDRWQHFAPAYPGADQSSFTQALYEQGFNVSVLPQNFNYRAGLAPRRIYGPLKIWHSRAPIPDNIQSWNTIEPPVFGTVRVGLRRSRVTRRRNVFRKVIHSGVCMVKSLIRGRKRA